jgi:CubicO group peptidase (beta-lactamase class C family)
MKNLSLGLVLILLLSTFYSCRHHKLNEGVIRKTKYKESIKKAYQDLGVFCVTNFIPGMAVCVSIDNEIVWADGFGLANKELNAPATPLTKFRIGDVSQVITALTAAKMAEEKRIDIDKPISTYIPEMAGKDTITIRQLAAHSAGIREEMDPDRNGLINTSLTKGIERFINDPLLYNRGHIP